MAQYTWVVGWAGLVFLFFVLEKGKEFRQLSKVHVDSGMAILDEQLSRVEKLIQEVKHQNEEIFRFLQIQMNLQKMLAENRKRRLQRTTTVAPKNKNTAKPKPADGGPSLEYEQTRRRLETVLQETWYFYSSHLKNFSRAVKAEHSSNALELVDTTNRILQLGFDHKRLLMTRIWRLAEVDGYSGWRTQAGAELNRLVEDRLHRLQDGKKCSTRGSIYCEIDNSCGFGCQLHTLAQCFIMAYGYQRTFLLSTENWNYILGSAGWETYFRPLTDRCRKDPQETAVFWRGNDDEDFADILEIVIYPNTRHPYLPMSVPKEFKDMSLRLYGSPFTWWLSRFLLYLVRENETMRRMIQEAERKIKLKKPYVGIHVRRSDKLVSEAEMHGLDRYMEAAAEHLATLELAQELPQKRIYLASDDVSVHREARHDYPQFEFYGNETFAALDDLDRNANDSFRALLIDLHFLANADYVVCTFSSTFCRTAYALMHQHLVDPSAKFRSLDDVYFYAGHEMSNRRAITGHKPRAPWEIELAAGDQILYAGNHWNGFSKGINDRTKAEGMFPSHKVEEENSFVDFPKFPDGPL